MSPECPKCKYAQNRYTQKFYEELFLFSLENAYDWGLISHDENFTDYVKSKQDISNFYVMNLSVLADSIEDVYYDITDVYYSSKVNHAIGGDLDDIGRIVGCVRPPATFAEVEVTFTTETYDSVRTIPQGIVLSTATGIVYHTTTSKELPANTSTVNVQARAMEAGIKSRVLAGALNKIDTNATDEVIGVTLKSCTNQTSSSGGNNAYTDDEYRELLLDWRKANIRGSKEAYEYFFSQCDGIDSYKLIPNWNGTGTLKVVLDPGTPDQLRDVYAALNSDVSQFTEDISMFAPEPVPIDIYAICNVDIDMINPYSSVEKEAIRSRIVDAVKLYIDGDVEKYTGLGIGVDFIPYKLGVFLSELVPELKDITFKYPCDKDTKEVVPITITDEQKATAHKVDIVMV